DAPLGMSPRLYRQGARGLVLQLTCLPTPFGILVVVTSQRGLCFVGFADTETQANALAHAEFPAAELQMLPHPSQIALQVESLLHSHPNHVDIPLDIKATAFQQRVWQALRTIPPGETRTYAEIADAIAQPGAIRAVANACAQNPIAIVIPCHRVVHRDPNRSGYRWSTVRKRAILAYEQEDLTTGGESCAELQ
ncbi:MAG: methylated-DNA--[protein]-cysteine S-methyltransferase, partial [Roseiflexaceae bacterium]